MAIRRGSSGVATKALGGIVGLLLALYVFDQVLDAVLDAMCGTFGGYSYQYNASAISTAVCENATNTGSHQMSMPGYFSSAVVFVDNLLPVVGILGAFAIIYIALRKMGLM